LLADDLKPGGGDFRWSRVGPELPMRVFKPDLDIVASGSLRLGFQIAASGTFASIAMFTAEYSLVKETVTDHHKIFSVELKINGGCTTEGQATARNVPSRKSPGFWMFIRRLHAIITREYFESLR
jgi:hypothetical protein